VPPELARQKRRPQRRDQILAAAVQLFHEHGYHATGMDEIGAAAGITGPGVYRHFRSKEDILETLVRERGEATVERMERIVAADLSPREAIEQLAQELAEEVAENPGVVVVAMYERRTLSAETRTWLDRMERRTLEAWVELLQRARPDLDDAQARLTAHATLMMSVAIGNYNSGLDDTALVRLVQPMIVRALLGDTAQPATRKRRSVRA
jgi:AcrR family transcriptional regulator